MTNLDLADGMVLFVAAIVADNLRSERAGRAGRRVAGMVRQAHVDAAIQPAPDVAKAITWLLSDERDPSTGRVDWEQMP